MISSGRAWLYRLAAALEAPLFELGNLESDILRKRLEPVAIDRPIYVTGLARAGTTIALEIIASQPGVATHRYYDFPMLPVIYHWRKFLHRFAKDSSPVERSHQDGLQVTPASPEAFEEMLWIRFFRDRRWVLDARDSSPAFETFYRDHIRKLLLVENAQRYAAKGNYNLTRMGYLARLFPDARFVVAVRHPVNHIASLMKQHAHFCTLQKEHPALLRYMQQAGHFEFGLDRRFILPVQGNGEVEQWARYWNALYSHVLEHPVANMLTVSHESLCQQPQQAVETLLAHCGLNTGGVAAWTEKLHAPDYYKPEFSASELKQIADITGATAARFGYSL